MQVNSNINRSGHRPALTGTNTLPEHSGTQNVSIESRKIQSARQTEHPIPQHLKSIDSFVAELEKLNESLKNQNTQLANANVVLNHRSYEAEKLSLLNQVKKLESNIKKNGATYEANWNEKNEAIYLLKERLNEATRKVSEFEAELSKARNEQERVCNQI